MKSRKLGINSCDEIKANGPNLCISESIGNWEKKIEKKMKIGERKSKEKNREKNEKNENFQFRLLNFF